MKTVLAFSGGLDSSVLLYYLLDKRSEIIAINFSYGSKHNKAERLRAREIIKNLPKKIKCYKEISLDFMGDYQSNLLKGRGEIPKGSYKDKSMSKNIVPFRNGIFLSILAGFASSYGFDQIAIANHLGDHIIFPDCQESFINKMGAAIIEGLEKPIFINSPFCNFTKDEIVSLGWKLGVPLFKTYSCYNGGTIHCGECGTCIERKEAILLAGLIDGTKYKNKGNNPDRL